MTAAAIFGLAGLLALGKKLIDLARMVTNWRTQRSGIATQVAAFAVFVGLVFLFGAAQAGAKIELVPGLALADLNTWAKVILGLQLGAGGSLVADWLQARDNHDSPTLPPLRLPGVTSTSVHPAEQFAADAAGGPILADAVLNVKPELDGDDLVKVSTAMHSAASEGLTSAVEAAVAALDAAAAAAVAKATAVPALPNDQPA